MRASLGSSGSQLMSIFLNLIRHHSEKDNANALEKDIFKVVSKLGLVINSEMSDEVITELKEPNYVVAVCIMEQLDKPLQQRKMGLLKDMTIRAFANVKRIMQSYVKGESLARLHRILEYFTSGGFLDFVFMREENEADCSLIRHMLSRLMLSRGNQVAAAQQHLRNLVKNLTAKLRSLEPLTTGKGLSLSHFMAQGEALNFFCDYLTDKDEASGGTDTRGHETRTSVHALSCYMGLAELRQLRHPQVIPIRASALFEKYCGDENRPSFLGRRYPGAVAACRSHAATTGACSIETFIGTSIETSLESALTKDMESQFSAFCGRSTQWQAFIREVAQIKRLLELSRDDLELAHSESGGTL